MSLFVSTSRPLSLKLPKRDMTKRDVRHPLISTTCLCLSFPPCTNAPSSQVISPGTRKEQTPPRSALSWRSCRQVRSGVPRVSCTHLPAKGIIGVTILNSVSFLSLSCFALIHLLLFWKLVQGLTEN